jgi:hypothetical protein
VFTLYIEMMYFQSILKGIDDIIMQLCLLILWNVYVLLLGFWIELDVSDTACVDTIEVL